MAGGEREGVSWQSWGALAVWAPRNGEGSLHTPVVALARLWLLNQKITATLVFPPEP